MIMKEVSGPFQHTGHVADSNCLFRGCHVVERRSFYRPVKDERCD